MQCHQKLHGKNGVGNNSTNEKVDEMAHFQYGGLEI